MAAAGKGDLSPDDTSARATSIYEQFAFYAGRPTQMEWTGAISRKAAIAQK